MSYQSGVQRAEAGGCEEVRITRTALIALRNSGGLSVGCPYTITDPNAQGSLSLSEVVLTATAVDALGTSALFLTTHDSDYWAGVYELDLNDVLSVTDNLGNSVSSNVSVIAFPFGVATVMGNTVQSEAIVTHSGGTVEDNKFSNKSNTTILGGNFSNNTVNTDATVSSNGLTVRNVFEAGSNSIISSGDFRDNRVEADANVNSSTTGDVDKNIFSQASNATISGGNLDNTTIHTDGNIILSGGSVVACKIGQNGNLTMSGGSFADSTIAEDAQVTIISGANYENVFGASTIYTQVGTGYIRYSTIEGTTTWTNGNTNVSNVMSYVSTVNTTGSTGLINSTTFNRAYCPNMQNVPSLTITDSAISNYAQVSITGATRLYLYRGTVTDGGRVLVSAGARIDSSYTNVNSYGYLQCNQDGGVLTVNYCEVSSISYIRNITPNSHTAQRSSVSGSSRISFEGDSSGCRVYYSSASGGGSIYHSGTSTNCYMYYCSAIGLGQVYTTNSVTARIYYCSSSGRGYVRSLNCPGAHYMYYCSATASGYVQMSAALGRMYAVHAAAQSIVEKRGAQATNLYYSTFTGYYYAYVTKTTGTVSGLYGMGRRSYTVTDPVTIAPYNQGVAWQNF